jgi:hypothetical protein
MCFLTQAISLALLASVYVYGAVLPAKRCAHYHQNLRRFADREAWSLCRATTCNGHPELCNRSYGNVTFFGAHDSFAFSRDPLARTFCITDSWWPLCQPLFVVQSQETRRSTFQPNWDWGLDYCKARHICAHQFIFFFDRVKPDAAHTLGKTDNCISATPVSETCLIKTEPQFFFVM